LSTRVKLCPSTFGLPVPLAGGQRREIPGQMGDVVGRVAAGDAERQVRLGVILAVELLHVVQRDALQALDGADRGMAVGVPLEDLLLEQLEAERFVVAAQRAAERGGELVLVALEVLGREAGLEQRLLEERRVAGQRVPMDGAADGRHLAVGVGLDPRGHRIEGLDQVGVGAFLRPRVADHQRRQRRQTLFAGGVVDRADVELEADRHQRRAGVGERHHLDGGGGGLGPRGGRQRQQAEQGGGSEARPRELFEINPLEINHDAHLPACPERRPRRPCARGSRRFRSGAGRTCWRPAGCPPGSPSDRPRSAG
jgi:hypothetical protein